MKKYEIFHYLKILLHDFFKSRNDRFFIKLDLSNISFFSNIFKYVIELLLSI